MILRNIMLWLSLLALSCANPAIEVAKADYQASFQGTNFSGLTRSSTIAEYDGTIDDSGNLLDISGSNYFTYSSQFDNAAWTKAPGTASITADAVQCPIGSNNADLFVEGTAGSGDTNQIVGQVAPTLATGTYTLSIYALFPAGGRSWFILRNAGAANKDVFFNIETGAVGTVESAVTAYAIQPVGGGWYRLQMQTTETSPGSTWAFRTASADNTFTYIGDGRGAVYVCGAQLNKNDAWRKGPGVYHPTVAVNKPAHDLAPTNTPTAGTPYLQGADGNLIANRRLWSDGTARRYSVAHHDSMYIFDTDFTVTYGMSVNTCASGNYFFNHGADNARGMRFYYSSGASLYRVLLSKAGDSITLDGPSSFTCDNKGHVAQIVRSSDRVQIGIDGTYTNPSASVAGYGIDGGGDDFVFGTTGSASDIFLQYVRIDAEALPLSTLVKEREKLQGIMAYAGGTSFPEHTFTRATTATTEFNNGSLGYVASGVPRVSEGFLSEPLSQNIAVQSQVLGTSWTASYVTIENNSATIFAPDGTATAEVFHEQVNNDVHMIYQAGPNGGAQRTLSAYFYPINRQWAALYMNDSGTKIAYYNISNCTTGTKTVGVTSYTTPSTNGWCRAIMTYTSAGNVADYGINAASADNTNSYVGGDYDAFAAWGVHFQTGALDNTYTPTTTAAVTRNADVLTIDPFRYDDQVRQGSSTAMFNFDQDPTAATVSSTAVGDYGAGTFTFTESGTRVRETTDRYGTYWKFDGSGTRLSMSTVDAAFIPGSDATTGDFSIVGAIIPDTPPSTYGYVFGRYDTTGNDREYAFYLNQSGTCTFAVSHDGTNPTYATKTGTCYVAGRPLFFAATYDYSGVADAPGATTGTSIGKLYINDMTVVTDTAFLGPVRNGAATLFVGRSTGGSYFQGKMLWLNWYKGTVLDATTIANMYDQWKQKWLIAPFIGTGYADTKVRMQFDYKLRSASASAGGDSLVEIGGNYGKSDVNSNRIACQAITTTLVCSFWNDTTVATQRTITVSGLVQNQWHTVNYYVDVATMANSTMTVDGVAGTGASLAGNHTLNMRDASIHIGHDYTGAAGFANGWVKNVKVLSTP
jgi:hypothetical protein